jgi:hypothetical protein
MPGTSWKSPVAISILYALFLLAIPFTHSDLVCHLNDPLHCQACAASTPGAEPPTPIALVRLPLVDAGRAVTIQAARQGALLPARSNGRSPPAGRA